ncbi:MAG TPA: M12 family metallopeptidase [Leptospiraceae bacterium]|nr:M12 family metallopeptidase [Leptospiraceae bacterium]HRG74221.1 M12 family metallopeptidase [Leptospiraceae bacterium]
MIIHEEKKQRRTFNQMRKGISAFLLVAFFVGCNCNKPTDDLNEKRVVVLAFLTQLVTTSKNDFLSQQEFKNQAFRETYQGKATGVYIVNGDTPISSEKLMVFFYEEYVKTYNRLHSDSPRKLGYSIVYNNNGTDIVWNATQKLELTFCISNSFSASRKAIVIQAMNDASLAWQAAANVKFTYVPSLDATCSASNTNVLFDIEPTSGQSYVARSFFPNDARSARNIMIDDTAFNVSWPLSQTGILRHELGHILGLRHEHTRPEAGVCFEDNNWRILTAYDPNSVMHYPQCNGTGDWSLGLTVLDKQGVSSIYGKAVVP